MGFLSGVTNGIKDVFKSNAGTIGKAVGTAYGGPVGGFVGGAIGNSLSGQKQQSFPSMDLNNIGNMLGRSASSNIVKEFLETAAEQKAKEGNSTEDNALIKMFMKFLESES